ncbi:unnamed protein product [Pedinophyceae sp. YPF-701]|nr:unnamed protein product [Pedinophyceae sp. YPF-701]
MPQCGAVPSGRRHASAAGSGAANMPPRPSCRATGCRRRPELRPRDVRAHASGASGPVTHPYVVRPGDNLWSIARSHGIYVRDILRANRWPEGASEATIYEGEVIRLPSHARSAARVLNRAEDPTISAMRTVKERGQARKDASDAAGCDPAAAAELAGRRDIADLWPESSSYVTPMSVPDVEALMRASAYNPAPHDTLLVVYAPWCPHCRTMSDAFEHLAAGLAMDPSVKVAKIRGDLPETRSFAFRSLDARTFPTVVAFSRTNGAPVKMGSIQRDTSSLLAFLNDAVRSAPGAPQLELGANGPAQLLRTVTRSLFGGGGRGADGAGEAVATVGDAPRPAGFGGQLAAGAGLVLGTLALLATLRGLVVAAGVMVEGTKRGAAPVADAWAEGRDAVVGRIQMVTEVPRPEAAEMADIRAARRESGALLAELREALQDAEAAHKELGSRARSLSARWMVRRWKARSRAFLEACLAVGRVLQVFLTQVAMTTSQAALRGGSHALLVAVSMARQIGAALSVQPAQPAAGQQRDAEAGRAQEADERGVEAEPAAARSIDGAEDAAGGSGGDDGDDAEASGPASPKQPAMKPTGRAW